MLQNITHLIGKKQRVSCIYRHGLDQHMRIVEDYPRVIRTCTVQQRILTDPLDTKHGVDLLDAQMSASLFRGPPF